MRRPSTEQNEDDLNRLTASASVRSNDSVDSTQTVIKAINNNNNNINNDNNNNKNNSSNNYLPNIIIAANTEYQQQCRKRKDRQDSTSSITQDRKVVRSSSEEHVPSCPDPNDAIRRVSSHEDFNNQKQLLSYEQQAEHSNEDVVTTHDELKISNSIDDNVIADYDGVDEINNQSSGNLTSAENSLIDVPPHVVHLSPITNKGNDFLDENEKRRTSERFLKTKSPSGRKSPRRSKKTSPTVFKGVNNENIADDEDDDGDDENSEMKENEDNDENMPNSPVKSKPLYPWESTEDQPIVCQRFSENSFDRVNHSISNFVKHDHDLVKFNLTVDDDDDDIIMPPSHTSYTDKKHYRSNFMNIDSIKPQKSRSPLPAVATAGFFETPDERIRHINKRLTSLKKKVSTYEESFEINYGYRLSHADKSSDKNIKHYIAEIHKLRKEKSQIKADPITAMGYKNKFDDSMPVEKKLTKLKDTLHDIEKVHKI